MQSPAHATSASCPAPWWSALVPGLADLTLAVLLVGIIPCSQGSMLDDPGMGWHLRNVDAMLAEGNWLTEDPFSWHRETRAWRTNQWLGDLALWCGWQWAGLEGIAAVTTILLALLLRHLFRILSQENIPWPLALLWTYLATLGISSAFVARPNVFTLLGVLVTASVLDRFHRGKCSQRATYWLLALMLVWVNTHGGFLAGLMLLAAAIFIEAALALGIPSGDDRAGARKRLPHLIRLFGLTWLCTLINPYGWKIYVWTYQLLGNSFFMKMNQEWHSPDFNALGAFRYEVLLLAFPLLLALSRQRPSLMALGLSLIWLHFGLTSNRYIVLWVLVTVPLLARLATEIPALEQLGKKLQLSPDLKHSWSQPARRCSPLFTSGACLALLLWARGTNDYANHAPEHIPTAALQHVLEKYPDQRIFHHHDWGGWLTWHGWPQVKNWLDDRAEVQGQQHLEQYLDIMAARAHWEQILEKQNVGVVCVPPHTSLAWQLSSRPRWQVSYRDDYAVVFERIDSISSQFGQ